MRRTSDYRQMLLATKGIGEYISSVILFDETIRQAADDRTLFRQSAGRRASSDQGGLRTKPLAGSPGDQVTEDSTDFASAAEYSSSARASPSGGR
jgi:fructose-bisphosphate aldolase class I